MSEQDDNFLSRWSRRKAQVQQVQQGVPAAAADPVVVVPFPVPTANPARGSGITYLANSAAL